MLEEIFKKDENIDINISKSEMITKIHEFFLGGQWNGTS